MSKRKLYPSSAVDRKLLWGGLIFIVLAYSTTMWWITGRLRWTDLVSILFGVVFFWGWIYFHQDLPTDKFENYSTVISNIEGISTQLTEVLGFLREEQQKVVESEATLRKLRDEKTQLEPVVLAQRDTVNAILAAHANATASSAWKERALGFISGLFASLLAAVLLEYFRR